MWVRGRATLGGGAESAYFLLDRGGGFSTGFDHVCDAGGWDQSLVGDENNACFRDLALAFS